jgi:hypothetical protein
VAGKSAKPLSIASTLNDGNAPGIMPNGAICPGRRETGEYLGRLRSLHPGAVPAASSAARSIAATFSGYIL